MPARWPSGRRMSGDGQLRPIIHCLYAPCQGEPGGGPSDAWAGPTTSPGRATPQGPQAGAALSGRRAAEAGTAARTAMRWESVVGTATTEEGDGRCWGCRGRSRALAARQLLGRGTMALAPCWLRTGRGS